MNLSQAEEKTKLRKAMETQLRMPVPSWAELGVDDAIMSAILFQIAYQAHMERGRLQLPPPQEPPTWRRRTVRAFRVRPVLWMLQQYPPPEREHLWAWAAEEDYWGAWESRVAAAAERGAAPRLLRIWTELESLYPVPRS